MRELQPLQDYNLYGYESVSHPTNEEAEALAIAAQSGDTKARDRLVLSNMRLVLRLAVKTHTCVPVDDRIGYGMIGLLRAVDKFRPGQGATFTAYACTVIIRSILRASVKYTKCVSYSEPTFWLAKKVIAEMRRARAAGEIASLEETAVAVGAQPDQVKAVCKAVEAMSRKTTSEFGLLNAMDEKSGVDLDADYTAVYDAIEDLDEQDQQVLVMRHGLDGGDPKQLKEIAAAMGVSFQRCHQRHERAVKRLRVKLWPAVRDGVI